MSKLEDRIIYLLRKILNSIPIKREVPVKKLFPEYTSGRDRYDIVIPSLQIIIECHGAQHHKLVKFGKENLEDTYEKFINQKRRDSRKEEIAYQNNWSFIKVWYNELTNKDNLDETLLRKKLRESLSQ